MEQLFQELLFTLTISLFVSFLLAKLLSRASACDVADETSPPATDQVIGEPVVVGPVNYGDKTRPLNFVEELIAFDDLKLKDFSVGTVGSSSVLYNSGKVACKEEEETDEFSLGELKELNVGGDVVADNLFDESPERGKEIEFGTELVRDVSDVVYEMLGMKTKLIDEEGDEGLYDDWEGVERTELERIFGSAVAFVGCTSNADRISDLEGDVKNLLHGLHKVAIEGPCFEPQPMALKISARAKWNAWQRLGDMRREVAMEQYVSLLSECVPRWEENDTKVSEQHFSDAGAIGNLQSKLHCQIGAANEKGLDQLKLSVEECDMTNVEGSNINKDKA